MKNHSHNQTEPKMCRPFIFFVMSLWCAGTLHAQNPIVPNQGLNDPHIHIFNDTAYVYASHDKSSENTGFVMEDWWVWSSPDLVNWTRRSTLAPQDTYLGRPFQSCWATDAAYRDGQYYWYFSEKNQQSGVVVGDSPVGPWKDPLGKPLLAEGLTPTHEYDMAVFEDNGSFYILFGVWDYYIAKLNPDMISLAEEPRKVIIKNPRGPYNQDGTNTKMATDDKPFLHKYQGRYYLSWGCFYAMSDHLYGPYDYSGSVINEDSFAPGYEAPTWPNGFLQGRHGSFFEWHNQWYYAYCDISQTGNRYFRDTFISYVHYQENGKMAPIRVDGVGVGRYEADQPNIEAEDYFWSHGFEKAQSGKGFVVRAKQEGFLIYPNIDGVGEKTFISIKLKSSKGGTLTVRKDNSEGLKLGTVTLPAAEKEFVNVTLDELDLNKVKGLCLVFMPNQSDDWLMIDSFSLTQ